MKRHVFKRIVTTTEAGIPVDDARHLASIVNEMRILANETLRQCQTIVTLLAVSWYETPSYGRFWPQLLLECAEERTLSEYIKSNRLTFQSKVLLGLDIVQGLSYLHIHKVVHCDLKPANILIFANSDTMSMDLKPVVAKLCDFGSAVIISDYEPGHIFRNTIGTFPWMSPELENSLSTEIDLLPKTDVYSFGLLMASLFMDGTNPFGTLSQEEISILKCVEIKDGVDSAYSTVLKNMQRAAAFRPTQEPFVQKLLAHTLNHKPTDRSDWETIFRHLTSEPALDIVGATSLVDTTASATNLLRSLTIS
jgi:serine/threonine protein kinase